MKTALTRAALIGTLPVALALRFSLAMGRGFQVDEIEHIHAAYNTSTGLVAYRDFIQGHTPLLHFLLLPFVHPEHPVGTLLSARVLMFFVSVAILLFVYLLARRIATPEAAALAVVLLSLHTTFNERGIEVRPDPWLALFSLVAIWLEARPAPPLRTSVFSALAISVAFLITQKALFVCLAIGLVWIARSILERSPRRLLAAVGAFLVPVALSLAYFAYRGALRDYVLRAFLYPFGVFAGHEAAARTQRFSPVGFLIKEALRNQLFSILAIVGLVWLSVIALSRRGIGVRVVVVGSWFVFAGLWLNPYPFPYFHPTVLPFVAICAGVLAAALLNRAADSVGPATFALILIGFIALCGVRSVPRLVEKANDPTRDAQRTTLLDIQKVTAPGDTGFDLVGLYFRGDAYPVYVMTGVMAGRYRMGVYPPMIPYFRDRGLTTVTSNYRMQWLPPAEQRFLRTHFVQYRGNVFVQGRGWGPMAAGSHDVVEVLRQKEFWYVGPPRGIAIDGQPFAQGPLSRGLHRVDFLAPTRSTTWLQAARPYPRTLRVPPSAIFVNFD